jgi:hypothetical protein
VGGVSEEPARRKEGAILPTPVRVRDGGRHPGSRKVDVLRGMPAERGPRSVRHVSLGLFPESGRTDDSGCPEDAEEGNVVGMRHKAHAPGARPRAFANGDASFTRSFDTCTSIATQLLRRKPTEVAHRVKHRGRANPRKGEEPAPGLRPSGRSAARRASPLPQGRSCVTRTKRKEIEVSVPARIESSG